MSISGKKADLAARINDHAKSSPTTFINADAKDDDDDVGFGKELSSRPKEFVGVMP